MVATLSSETNRQVRDVQRRVRHSAIPWMAATLDGIVEGTEAVFEAKFMLPWSFSEEAAAEKYMAQVQHNMWVNRRRKYGLAFQCLRLLELTELDGFRKHVPH
jgi:YqaJ-like viral recombinase domain